MTENVSRLVQKVDDLSEAVKKQEQYSRHNCLLLHVIPEKKKENTDKLCIDRDRDNRDIDRTHRIRNLRNAGEKSRTIIIKIVRYNGRKKIFDSNKKLRGKKIAFMEGFIVTCMRKLNDARERYNFKYIWTSEGKVSDKDGLEKIKVYYS